MRYRFQEGVFLRNIQEEVVLYDTRRDQIHCFNASGANIVAEINKMSPTKEELFSLLSVKYTVDDHVCAEIDAFLCQLIEMGLLCECE